ncbi:MAG: hypothetical protein Unbinned5081contig1002_1 [Prokaryotic dsDNA virus sp.]|nr:MAG: hypothetical protein Unbinned5081contig1002_1 [Prokaryotic dsDNA virus sp.]|tara:strand:+ start:6928 stop:7128 length:201 start_codon:yes stop_codon:yes gene_type:complete
MIEDAWDIQVKYPMGREEFKDTALKVAEEFRGHPVDYVREQTALKLARITGEHAQDVLNKIYNWIR